MANPFYTIGHSIRTIPEFVDLLREANVGLVVDVRTVPRSRTNPQFNRDALPESLAGYQIGYEHIAELGALRRRQRLIEPSPNGYWENASFRNYADNALTDRFREGLDRLTDLGSRSITAVVRRGGVVAVSSPDHRRPPARLRPLCVSYPRPWQDRAGLAHARSSPFPGRTCLSPAPGVLKGRDWTVSQVLRAPGLPQGTALCP
jgi:hypothetical protein